MTIEVTNFDNDIANTGTVSSDSLNIIVTDGFFSSATSFNGFSFRNLAITAGGNLNLNTFLDLDNLTLKIGTFFENYGSITAGNFTITVENYFNNNGEIFADNFTVAGTGFNNNGGVINAASFTVTLAENFNNTIKAVINATSFNVTVGATFLNRDSATINADSLTVTANNFNTSGTSTIDAATVTIEVANFDDDISNADRTVSAASLNFILTDDFTHASDSFTGFTNFSNLTVSSYLLLL